MKTAMTLPQLANELQRQKETRRDFVVDTRKLTADPSWGLTIKDTGTFPITSHAHRQLSAHLKVPAQFYDRLMTQHPDIWMHTVNELMRREHSERMVRTLDGSARAFLSNSYRRIDNYEVAEMVLPLLAEVDGLQIESANVTERKMYLKARINTVTSEVFRKKNLTLGQGHHMLKRGDVVCSAITITNSEIGDGSFMVSPAIYEYACTNLAVFSKSRLRRIHVGARIDADDVTLLSDETKQADDHALMLKLRDIVKACLDKDWFDAQVAKINEAATNTIEGNPFAAVKLLSNNLGIGQDVESGILRHLITGADLSQWGLSRAVTRASQDVDDYDLASDLEVAGGTVIDLPKKEWRQIATAT